MCVCVCVCVCVYECVCVFPITTCNLIIMCIPIHT